MRMPGADRVVIEPAKLRDYLLSLTHPVGKHKAAFFMSFGYTPAAWTVLEVALRRHAVEQAVDSVEVRSGMRYYCLAGPLPSPDGREPSLKSVWEVPAPGDDPRFITAYPA